MITRTEIEQLATYEQPEAPVISFYMNIDKGRPDEMKWNIRLKNLVNQIEGQRDRWSDAQWESIAADVERIRRFVGDQRVLGAVSVAIFASSAANFWQPYTFPTRTRNEVRVNHTAYVRPLFRLLDSAKPQCVALVSQDQGRVFLLWGAAGEVIEERGDLVSDIPRRHDQGGWSQANLQRRHDDAVRHHLKQTADMIFTLAQSVPFERLLIGGADTVTKEFQGLLHPYLRERLVATFSAPIAATPKTVQERVRPILQALEAQKQSDLVADVAEEVGQRDKGVAGLADTLEALRQGQVLTLVLAEDYTAAGHHCRQCDSLLTNHTGRCPHCGSDCEDVDDIVAAMVEQALGRGAQVYTISTPAALARLEPLGQVGALLRFAMKPVPAT